MRRARGFTLLELGVVIGVMAILMAGISVTTARYFSNAKAERMSRELDGLLLASATALQGVSAPNYQFFYDGLSPSLDAVAPTCFDLSQGVGTPVSDCSAAGVHDWNSAGFPIPVRNPVNANTNPILLMFGGKKANSGYNPWCVSYVICLRRNRVEVAACVPKDDAKASGLTRFNSCGPCSAVVPGSGERTECVFGTRSAGSIASNVRLSYDNGLVTTNLPYLQ
jgi:prepilin-type N-terminal cleavage/methylation domain-containing protein